MTESNKKYWIHRIKGGENGLALSDPLLFSNNVLATGWAELSTDEFVKTSNNNWDEFQKQFFNVYGCMRNRYSLWRYLSMKKGDIVVVPTWGNFSIFKIADDNIYTNESIQQLLASDKLKDWNGSDVHLKNGYLYDANDNFIDLGFYRRVEPICTNLPRQEYADQALFSRMKIMQTNADVSDLSEKIEESIKRAKNNNPICIYKELIGRTLPAAKEIINDYVQHITYEDLVEKYLWAIGANEVLKPATNESSTDEGDADRVAYFEQLKVAVMVQIKKHDSSTDDWAVNQIELYKNNHINQNEDYNVQLWVISNAEDFTEEAKRKAREANVRLINGDDFAKMILDVGLKHFM